MRASVIWGIMQVEEGPDLRTLDTLYNCSSELLKATWSVYKETSMVKKERKASGEDQDNTYCINFGNILDHTLWSNASL